jgi:hypothetical protein
VAQVSLGDGSWPRAPRRVRFTLVSSGGDSWAADEFWQPCWLPVPGELALPLSVSRTQRQAAQWAALNEHLQNAMLELERTRASLAEVSARWAAVADLGPTSVAVARRLRRWSRRLPGVAALVKRSLR